MKYYHFGADYFILFVLMFGMKILPPEDYITKEMFYSFLTEMCEFIVILFQRL